VRLCIAFAVSVVDGGGAGQSAGILLGLVSASRPARHIGSRHLAFQAWLNWDGNHPIIQCQV
jgi:hypothetical protein